MSQVFVKSYKDVIASYKNLKPFEKATAVCEELSEAKNKDDDLIYDYGTITKAIIEAYIGKEIDEHNSIEKHIVECYSFDEIKKLFGITGLVSSYGGLEK